MRATPSTGDRIVPTWSADLEDYVTVTAPSPDGEHLLVASLSGRAAVLDGTTGVTSAELPPHPFGVLAGAWSADGDHLATAGQDGLLRIHRRFGEQVAIPLDGWGASVSWSPVAPLVAVAAGTTVAVYDPAGGLVARWPGLPSTVTAVAWSVDGVSVGASCYGGIHWFRPAEPDRPTRHFAWKGSLLSLHPAPNGRWVASGCQDNSVHVWRLWSGDDLQMSGYPAKIEHLAWDPGARFLAVGSIGEVTVWDFSGRGPQGTRPTTLDAHERHVTAIGFSPDGSRLASADAAGNIILSAPSKRKSPIEHVDLATELSTLAWHPRGDALHVGAADGTITAFEVVPR